MAEAAGASSEAGCSKKRKRHQREAPAAGSGPALTGMTSADELTTSQPGVSGSSGMQKRKRKGQKQRPAAHLTSSDGMREAAGEVPHQPGSKHHEGSAKQHRKKKQRCAAEPAARSAAALNRQQPMQQQDAGPLNASPSEAYTQPAANTQPGNQGSSPSPAAALAAAVPASSGDAEAPQAAIPMARPASKRHADLPVLPEHTRNVGKPWTADEEGLLVRLVMDDEYRKRTLGVEEVDFEVIARHLGRLNAFRTCVRNKYWALERGAASEKGKAHSRPRGHMTYTLLAISALQRLPGCAGTAPEMHAVIEADPTLMTSLDWSTCPGTLTRPRWRKAISAALSANRRFFCNTSTKKGRHVVWELVDVDAAQDFVSRQAKDSVPYLGNNHR